MSNYINLFTKTNYSIFESSIRIDDLITFAKKNNIKTLAIADTNVLYGAMEFYEKCKKNKIKPIIGIDLKFNGYKLVIFARNYKGYQHIIELSSKFNGNIDYKLNIKIAKEDLFIVNHPENDKLPIIEDIEILPSEILLRTLCLYEDQWETLELLRFINPSKNTEKVFKNSFYKINPILNKELKINKELFKIIEKISKNCNLIIPKKVFKLPKFNTPNNITAYSHLKKICLKNLSEKKLNKNLLQKYLSRFEYELNILKEMAFINYFLIIYDFIHWAKNRKIVIGPGRGSAPGSLISYLLGITTIDPIEYDLLFERFLNIERVTFPDIDIDIEDTRRIEVINYLFDKYENDSVAHIITFQKFGAKMAIRDTAKYFDVPLHEVNELTNCLNSSESLEESYKNISLFKSYVDKNETIKKIFNLAKTLEGLPRQISTHAAGIVISDQKIWKNVPTIEVDGVLHTQFSMNYLESNGIIKIDILGLRNLSIINNIQNSIHTSFRRRINLEQIPLNIKSVHDLFTSGLTNGIFQFESRGMRNALREVKIDTFNDLIAVNALYRPGPMEYIELYAKRKNNKSPYDLISKSLSKILNSTYGIVVYQEQIMKIAQNFAGLSFSKADILRKAISKKRISEINSLKSEFYIGSKNLGHSLKEIDEVFSYILKFANYGFNKAHATAYSTIAYWMAFLKVKFPTHFFCSLMNTSSENPYLFLEYINEVKSNKINFIPPNINLSQKDFFIKNDNIIAPFRIIKGIGSVNYKKIIEERTTNGIYKDFFVFVARMKKNGIPSALIKNLIKGNALSEFGNKKTLLTNLDSAIKYYELISIKKEGKIVLKFNLIPKPIMQKQELDIFEESSMDKQVYDNFITIHPVQKFQTNKTKLLTNNIKSNWFKSIGLISRIKKIKTKKGDEMAFITFGDQSATIEVVVFPNIYKQKSHQLIVNNIIECNIHLQNRNNRHSFILEDVLSLKGKYEK